MLVVSGTGNGFPLGMGGRTPAGPAPTDPHQIPPDVIDLQDLPPGAQRVPPISDAAEAMSVAPPILTCPVLMVHGLAQHADTWANMKNFLCSAPQNVWGGVYRTDREAEFLRDAKPAARVFALDLSDNLASPRVVANEVRRAMDAIYAATGQKDVYVMTHSMGALVAREAVREGEGRIRKLLMISPPNHGAYEATLGSGLHDAGIYDQYPEEKMGAMEALRLEFGERGGIRNDYLHDLNEAWKNDPHRPQAAVITGIGIPTPDRSLKGGTYPGDAMVAARRAPLDGAEFYLAVPNKLPAGDPNFRDFQQFRYNHLQIVSEPEIYRQTAEFLGGPAPAPAPAPPAPPLSPLDQYLNDVQNGTEALRAQLVESEILQQHYSRWTRNGVIASVVGTGLMLAAFGTVNVSLPLSLSLLGTGIVSTGAGSYIAVVNAKRLNTEVASTTHRAEIALNLTDDLAHRIRQEPKAKT